MVNLISFLVIYTFIKLSLIIKELEANEISTLKIFGVSLNESDFIVQDVVLWYTLKVWFSDRFKQK